MVASTQGGDTAFDIDDGWSFIQKQASGRKASGQRVADRKASEQPHVPKTDGRRRRRTDRQAQMNLKVRQPVREEFVEIAKERGLSMGELFEQVLIEWKALNGGQK